MAGCEESSCGAAGPWTPERTLALTGVRPITEFDGRSRFLEVQFIGQMQSPFHGQGVQSVLFRSFPRVIGPFVSGC
jgi:hypothetical protein